MLFGLITAVNIFPTAVFAQGAQNGRMIQDQDRVNYDDVEAESTMAPEDNQVRNQVQNQFQNVDGADGFMAATQQMEQLMNMENIGEETGLQLRNIAQEQVQAQEQIQAQYNKLENRSSFMKQLFGTDPGAVKNLKMQLEQNQMRIQQLEVVAASVQNMGEVTQFQAAIQAMVQTNTQLAERIQAEERQTGIFGWILRLIQK